VQISAIAAVPSLDGYFQNFASLRTFVFVKVYVFSEKVQTTYDPIPSKFFEFFFAKKKGTQTSFSDKEGQRTESKDSSVHCS